MKTNHSFSYIKFTLCAILLISWMGATELQAQSLRDLSKVKKKVKSKQIKTKTQNQAGSDASTENQSSETPKQKTKAVSKIKKTKFPFKEEEELSGGLYQKYLGKVVFANSKIARSDPESKYANTYTLGDPLWIRAYFRHSAVNSMIEEINEKGTEDYLEDYFGKHAYLRLIIYLDGKKIVQTGETAFLDEEGRQKYKSVSSTLNDNSPTEYHHESIFQHFLQEAESMLTPGKHKLKIVFKPINTYGTFEKYEFKEMASGELDLIVPKNYVPDASTCFPKEVQSDPRIESEMMQAFRKKVPSEKALKAIIMSNNYSIVRDPYTKVILRKTIQGIIVSQKGNELFYTDFSFSKAYDGSKYIAMEVSGTGYQRKISSACKQLIK